MSQTSCWIAPAQQGGNFMFEYRQAVAREIWAHGNDDIACLRKLFPVQAEGLAKEPLYTVAPYRRACLALHTDAQAAKVFAIESGDNTKPLAMPPFPFFVDLLEFAVQVQAHFAGKGAVAGHGLRCQLFAALGSSSSDNSPPGTGAHADQKPMGAGA